MNTMPPADTPVPLEELLAHRGWVRQMARALVSCDADADDLAQDAWARALTHPPTRNSSLRGWFAVLLRHQMLNRRRTDSRRAVREALAARSAVVQRTHVDVVELAETHKRIVDAVVTLDEPYRTTVLLRYFEGMSAQSVAQRLDVPVTTVRSRVQRALAILREKLGSHDGAPRKHLLAIAEVPNSARPPHAEAGVSGGPTATIAAFGGLIVTKKLSVVITVILVSLAAWAVRTTIEDPPARKPVPQISFATGADAPTAAAESAREHVARGSRQSEVASDDPPQGAAVGVLEFNFAGLDGRPVADAIASLTTKDGETRSISSRDAGSVIFADVPVGRVDVVVRAAGFAMRRYRNDAFSGRARVHLTLIDGGETNVIVLADDGRPMTGARVWVLMGGRTTRTAYPMEPELVDEAHTDALGRARLVGIETSRPATVFADAPGRERASVVIQAVKGTPLSRTLRMARGGSLTGVLRDTDGAPLAASRVFALPPDARGHTATRADNLASGYGRSLRLAKGFSGLTDASGAFRIHGLAFGITYLVVGAADQRAAGAPAEVRVTAAAPSATANIYVVALSSLRVRVANAAGERVNDAVVRLTRPRRREPLASESNGEFVASTLSPGDTRIAVAAPGAVPSDLTVELRPGEETVVDVRLVAGRTVRGRVTDSDGEPVGTVSLSATPEAAPRRRVIVLADANGRFEFAGLGPDAYELVVLKGRGFVARDSLVIRPGVKEISVVVVRSAGVKLRVITQSGDVRDQEFRYEVRSEQASRRREGAGWIRRGTLDLSGVAPGRNDIRVLVAGFAPATTVIDVKAGETHTSDLVLDAGRSGAGRVVALDGTPISGARVMLSAAPSLAEQVATSDPEGRFVLHNLGSTEVELRVLAEGFLTSVVRLAPPETSRGWNIEMSRGALIRGVVHDVDGHPLESEAVVAVDPTTGRRVARVDTDAKGRFQLRVPAGPWRIELLDAPGAAIDTFADEHSSADVELHRDR